MGDSRHRCALFFPGVFMLFQRGPLVAVQQGYHYTWLSPSMEGVTAISEHGRTCFWRLGDWCRSRLVMVYTFTCGVCSGEHMLWNMVTSASNQPLAALLSCSNFIERVFRVRHARSRQRSAQFILVRSHARVSIHRCAGASRQRADSNSSSPQRHPDGAWRTQTPVYELISPESQLWRSRGPSLLHRSGGGRRRHVDSSGETRDLPITFLNVRGLAELLHVGRKWRIQEGGKLVATPNYLRLRMRSNHAMERTADRCMTRLKEELRIMKQATRALVRRRSSYSR